MIWGYLPRKFKSHLKAIRSFTSQSVDGRLGRDKVSLFGCFPSWLMFESDNTRFDHSPLSCWLFVHGSFNVIYSTCLAMPFFDLPSTFLSILLCLLACCSRTICLFSALKRWFGSGFLRLLTMFTSVSTFQTSSLLSMMSSWMWWYLTSICFVLAWYTRFLMRCIGLCESNRVLVPNGRFGF